MINLLGNRIVASQVALTTLKNSLVFCLELNETSGAIAVDEHSNNNDFANTNATINQAGIIDKSYSFNGIDSYLDNFSIGTFYKNELAITVSFWFKFSVSNNGILFEYSPNLNVGAFTTILNSDNTLTALQKGADGFNYGHSSAINDGLWHNFIAIFDRNQTGIDQTKIYIDNILDYTANSTTTLTDSFTLFADSYVGIRGSTLTYPFNGNLDQISSWNRALTSSERSLIYNSGVGLPYTSW